MPSLKKLLLAVAALVAVGVSAAGVQAQSYNAYNDFGPNNPGGAVAGGPWSYGYDNTPAGGPSAFPPDNFTLHSTYVPFPGVAESWQNGLFANEPSVRRNVGAVTLPDTNPGNGSAPVGDTALIMQPGNTSSIIRFTAPTTGWYNVSGYFQGRFPSAGIPGDPGGTGAFTTSSTVAVYQGAGFGLNLLPATVLNGTDSLPFGFISLHLTAGDILNFVVHFDPTINNTQDQTLFDVSITAVPEPGTLLILGISVLGMGVFAVKRRKSGDGAEAADEACV